jgi:hypothetical protein
MESLRGQELALDARASGFVFVLEKLLHSRWIWSWRLRICRNRRCR